MIFQNVNAWQIAFFIAVPIIVLGIAFFFVFLPIRRSYIKKRFRDYYYHTIRRISVNEDYYLINRFIFRIDDSSVGNIDHIIFGEKFIYIISDKYYDGNIKGKQTDKSLILIDKRGKKCYIDNPFLESAKLLTSLALNTDLDSDIMIGITVVNNGVNIGVKPEGKQFYAIQIKKLPQLIKAIESRPIDPLNEKQLARAVQGFDKINRRRD